MCKIKNILYVFHCELGKVPGAGARWEKSVTHRIHTTRK